MEKPANCPKNIHALYKRLIINVSISIQKSDKEQKVMENEIHFYSPGTHDYISVTSLWAVARVAVNEDGVRWLETVWAGGDDFQGMALYTSALDAAIAAEVLNQVNPSSEWQHYSLSDLNITEMMITVKAQRPKFCVMLVFGFSVDSFRNLVLNTNLYRSLQFPESFPIDDDLDPKGHKAVLKFDEEHFMAINDYWHEHFKDYCAYVEGVNALPAETLKKHARYAIAIAQATTTPIYNNTSHYSVSTYSIEKQMWIVSSLKVNGTKSANIVH